MPETDTPRHINSLLAEAVESVKGHDHITIGQFADVLHERGFGLLIFMFALPMALPLPVPPGINLMFAVPLLLLTAQQIFAARTPWLPGAVRRKTIRYQSLADMITKAAPWLSRLSFFIRPRLGWITRGVPSRMIGLFGFFFALCICVPIPLTNTVPSFAIVLMALGVLMRDGLTVLTGMIVGTGWIALLLTLGISGFKALMNAVF